MERVFLSPRHLAIAGVLVLFVTVGLAIVLVHTPAEPVPVPSAGQPRVTLRTRLGNESKPFLVRISCGSVSVCTDGFDPKNATIPAGSTVTWVSEESGDDYVYHRIIFRLGGVDSGQIDGGGEFTARFFSPGVYQYFDFYFPRNNGTITVVPSG